MGALAPGEVPLSAALRSTPLVRRSPAAGPRSAVCGAALLLAGCATGRSSEAAGLDDLRAQLRAQAERLAQQQQRIEQLEARLSAVTQAQAAQAAARPFQGQPAQVAPAGPPVAAPRPEEKTPQSVKPLQTVKLVPHSGRARLRERRPNPVERAPRLPAHVELKEPDEAALAELAEPLARAPAALPPTGAPAADRSFAEAVSLLNEGQYLSAQTAFLGFAAKHPRHAAAGDALYYAGLARAASGDCAGALHHYDRAAREYPSGRAVLPARLEKGRCLLRTGQDEAARAALDQLIQDHPASAEAGQARRLLAEAGN